MGRKGKGREGKGKGIVIKAPGVWLGRGRYLKVCSMHAPSHFPYAHSYKPSTPSLHLRFPHFPPAPSPSQSQPPTATQANRPAPWSRLPTYPATATYSHPATQPPPARTRNASKNPLKTITHSQSQTEPSEPRDFTLLYQPYLTLPTLPYHTNLALPTLPCRA